MNGIKTKFSGMDHFGSIQAIDWHHTIHGEKDFHLWRMKLAHLGFICPMLINGTAAHALDYDNATNTMFGHASATMIPALLAAAEAWLAGEGMSRVLGPISLSIWEEPGLLVEGHDHAPMIMMGHHPAQYAGWIEAAGFTRAKTLYTYDLDITHGFGPLVERLVQTGKRNPKINLRRVRKDRWDEEVATILAILNDAWSDNWGFVPFTPAEVAYAGKKLRAIIHEELNVIVEVDGRPVAFMLTWPDVNDALAKIKGKLFPFGWVHMLRWLRHPKGAGMRVPLMGVLKDFGVITVSPEAAVATGVSAAFFPHGLGHPIGLQVHDVAGFQDEDGQLIPRPEGHPFLRMTRTLAPGMVVTIEPGIYFIPTLLAKLREKPQAKAVDWKRIGHFLPFGGVRIEDEVHCTAGEPENLTRDAFAAA